MEKFNLDDFFKNYKPKEINVYPYLEMDKLKNYNLMNDKQELIPKKMYLQYIKMSNVFRHNKYSNKVIEDGGKFIDGGFFLNGKFMATDDKDKWTHLKLKTNISKKDGGCQRYYSYYIKIINYVIFYKNNNNNDRGRDFMIELLNKL